MIELRDYQRNLVDLTRGSAADGNKKILLVLPTGGGKTFVMAEIAKRAVERGGSVLCLMHRRQLVDQMRVRFAEYGIETGTIMAGVDPDHDQQVQLATIQTYGRRSAVDSTGLPGLWVDAAVVMVDEAHRSLSPTFQRVLRGYAEKVVIGVTATPCLASGVGMGRFYDDLVAPIGVGDLIEAGHLVRPRYFAPTKPDLAAVRTVAGDFEKEGLAAVMNRPKLIGDVFENWARIAGGKQTIVFCVNVKHSRALCREFQRRGVSAAHLDAHANDDERGEVLEALFQKDLQVVFNVGLYTEGFDYPGAECIVLARPTKSLGLYLQMAGRGLRPIPGKEDCTIIDHGGNVDRLGFVDEPIIWTLDGKKPANHSSPRRKAEKTPMTCEVCQAVFTGPVCPACGTEIEFYGKKIEAIEAELAELQRPKMRPPAMIDKREWFAMLEHIRLERGYRPGWSAHQYREKFGVWPRGVDGVEPVEPDLSVMRWIKSRQIRYAKSQASRRLWASIA